jgi:hypothetical protein
MPTGAVTTASVDYLQRYLKPAADFGGPATRGTPDMRRLLRVRGFGCPEKEEPRRALISGEPWRPPTTDLVTGLYGYRIPFAF